jgi:tetratricopeptide (TPR) repeat protein
VPGIPHAQHMYAHVLPRLGRWQEAAEQLYKADELQREYFETGISPVEEWHQGHNLHLLGVANLRLGNEAEGARHLKEAFELPVRGVRDGRFTNPWLEYLLMRGRFEEALAAARQAEQRSLAAARLIGAVRATEALIALSRMDEARISRERAQKELERLKQDSTNPIYDYLPGYYESTQLDVLDAEMGLLGSDPKSAEQELLSFADRLVDENNFDGWATGLFRLEQIAALAGRLGRGELVAGLVGRMRQIDPGFPSRFSKGVGLSQRTQPP